MIQTLHRTLLAYAVIVTVLLLDAALMLHGNCRMSSAMDAPPPALAGVHAP